MGPLRELIRGRLTPCILHAVHMERGRDWLPMRFAAARCSTWRTDHSPAITRSPLFCWLILAPFGVSGSVCDLPLRRGLTAAVAALRLGS